MVVREQNIDDEAKELWDILHDYPPPSDIHGCELLDVIVNGLSKYDHTKFYSPFLRPDQVVTPRLR